MGKPDPLKHGFQGYWSRRINDEHRLIYKATEDAVLISRSATTATRADRTQGSSRPAMRVRQRHPAQLLPAGRGLRRPADDVPGRGRRHRADGVLP
ncbi:type II toxin-antitoxin system YoeB family toxin [Streptomyces mirabilis]|uniref:type II toxin-antitoxin system YoeB family toxin n=1 Tax=Streptomyces mirabilis TaxID=68239 RepID=UPI0033294A2A